MGDINSVIGRLPMDLICGKAISSTQTLDSTRSVITWRVSEVTVAKFQEQLELVCKQHLRGTQSGSRLNFCRATVNHMVRYFLFFQLRAFDFGVLKSKPVLDHLAEPPLHHRAHYLLYRLPRVQWRIQCRMFRHIQLVFPPLFRHQR